MTIFLIALAAIVCCLQDISAKDPPMAVQGVLDLRQWDFEKDGVIDLSGKYEFFWMQHLYPHDFVSTPHPAHDGFITVPGIWNNRRLHDEKISGKGYATYRLRILLRKRQQLAFEFADMATAYRVYADGEEILSVGIAGTTHQATVPQYCTQVIEFTPTSNQFNLLLLVSNFHHKKGGAWETVKLGLVKDIRSGRERSLFIFLFIFFSIATMGIYHIVLSFFGGIHRPSLYFGIFCVLIALRSTTQGEIYFAGFCPMVAWELLVKIEYLTYYLAVPVFSMFFFTLYREESSKRIIRLIQGFSLIFCGIVLFTPVRFFSHTVPAYHAFTVLCCSYGAYLLFLCMARRRQGAGLLLIGFSILFICILNDILENIGLIRSPEIIPYGVLAFILCLTILIASRFTKAFKTVEMQGHELSAANENLKDEILLRKRAEEANQVLQEKLAHAQKMEAIGMLASGVAHDLNNMLIGVTTLPDILLFDLPVGSPLREPLEEIRNAGIRAGSVVQDLLALARRNVMQFEPLNLNHLLMEFLHSPEYQKLMIDHSGIKVRTSLAEDLLWIKGSPVHFRNLLMNFLRNAAEAQPENGIIIISTENRHIDRLYKGYEDINEGTYVVLTVEDKGVGIGPRKIGRIFEPFFTSKDMGRSGTGLGMTVVWGIIHDHNGCIDVKSAQGEGTAFDVYIPAFHDHVAESAASVFIHDLRGNNESILVVDDIAEQRSTATRALRTLGYKAASVASGEEAVEYVRNSSVDLVVLDMIMNPGINGFETYKRIIEIRPRTRAIIVSGYSETNDVHRAQELGAGKYLTKPYTLMQLAIAVREELSKGE